MSVTFFNRRRREVAEAQGKNKKPARKGYVIFTQPKVEPQIPKTEKSAQDEESTAKPNRRAKAKSGDKS